MSERYAGKIADLQAQTGWAISVNPQPNQGSILETARVLVNKAGLVISKGPSIYPEKAEVTLTLAADTAETESVAEAFLAQTGYRLVISLPRLPATGGPDQVVPKPNPVQCGRNPTRPHPAEQLSPIAQFGS